MRYGIHHLDDMDRYCAEAGSNVTNWRRKDLSARSLIPRSIRWVITKLMT
jgi:hypothetical protein